MTLINNPSRTSPIHYKCHSCQVEGYGTECLVLWGRHHLQADGELRDTRMAERMGMVVVGMSVYFSSDLHLGHTNVLKWRPFDSLDEMHDVIAERWNRTVKASDVVFILGDAVMGQRALTLPLVDRLNGYKALVPGNHDHVHPMFPKNRERWLGTYKQHFHGIFRPEAIWSLGGQWVSLCHFPRAGDHTEQERYSEWRPKDDGTWLLHGHLHGSHPTSPNRPRQIDVGVDAWDFTPVSEEQLLAIMEAS